jgi:hypothetical protein
VGRCILSGGEKVLDQQKGPVATQGEGAYQEDVVDGGQGEKGLQGHRQQGIVQVVGVEDEADAQGIEYERGVEGVGLKVKDGVFEPPHVP